MEKIQILANYLNVEVEELEKGFGEGFEHGNEEYTVLTEIEREEATKEYIRESLWAFNAEFILEHTSIKDTNRVVKPLRKMQEELCEDANELILALIGGEDNLEEFIDDAVMADGYGHFLSQYDGQENEYFAEDTKEYYYIYRNN